MSDWIYLTIYFNEDNLTNEEIFDVNTSWKEIRIGQAKKFVNLQEFLADLKE